MNKTMFWKLIIGFVIIFAGLFIRDMLKLNDNFWIGYVCATFVYIGYSVVEAICD